MLMICNAMQVRLNEICKMGCLHYKNTQIQVFYLSIYLFFELLWTQRGITI